MRPHQNSNLSSEGHRITLSSLKEQFCTLNMQMLLAMESHDEKTQEEIKKKMNELQEKMDQLSLGGKLLT